MACRMEEDLTQEMGRMEIKEEEEDFDDDVIECGSVINCSISSTPPLGDGDMMDDEESTDAVKLETPSFEVFGFCEELMTGIRGAKLLQPYATQAQVLMRAIQSRDILCETPSKSGKTAIFVLSTLHHLSQNRDKPTVFASPSVLVVVPTRELAEQIFCEYRRLGSSFGNTIRVLRVIGGLPKGDDEERFTLRGRNLIDVVVGTPGRILDLVNASLLRLGEVRIFVVDEVQRSLAEQDMRSDIQAIFIRTKPEKQTMLFAAALSDEARGICKRYLQDAFCVLEKSKLRANMSKNQHRYCRLHEDHKPYALLDLLKWIWNKFGLASQVVIFTDTIIRTGDLAAFLKKIGGYHDVIELDSALHQSQRLSNFSLIRQNTRRLMVATDLAARGLDIHDLAVVINYDRPRLVRDYCDRVRIVGKNVERSLVVTFARDQNDVDFLRADDDLKRFQNKEFDWQF